MTWFGVKQDATQRGADLDVTQGEAGQDVTQGEAGQDVTQAGVRVAGEMAELQSGEVGGETVYAQRGEPEVMIPVLKGGWAHLLKSHLQGWVEDWSGCERGEELEQRRSQV